MNSEVLVVGAGPTGLTLALWLRRFGIAVRVIDRSTGPGETSRALAVQARTLEFQRQIRSDSFRSSELKRKEALRDYSHGGGSLY